MLRWKFLATACVLTFTIGVANATTFDWSFTGEFDSGNGSLTASGSGGTLTVTSISGTISTPWSPIFGLYTITSPGLLAPGSEYASLPVPGDNLLFVPAAPTLVDTNGISFAVAQPGFTGEQFMDIFFTEGQYQLYVSNSGANSITFSVSPEISSTPLPATWLMMLTGLGVMGLFGWRRKRNPKAVAA